MRVRQRILATTIITAAALASGCRSGISVHGKSLGLFVVPMYKLPAGYSSTYHRHLLVSPPVVEHVVSEVVSEVGDGESSTVVPAIGESISGSAEPVSEIDRGTNDAGAAEVELLPAPDGPAPSQQRANEIREKEATVGDAVSRSELKVRPADQPVLANGRNRGLPGLIEPTP